jgi:hypothetical protein
MKNRIHSLGYGGSMYIFIGQEDVMNKLNVIAAHLLT